jgi:hypothetical protein
LRIVIPACDGPPRFSSKNFCCFLPGLPSVIVQATIRPSAGTTNMSRVVPIRVWNAVVREITSHGLVGQLGTGFTPTSPISMILADAVAGAIRTSATASAAKRTLYMPALNTSERSLLLCGGAAPRTPRRRAAQTFWTLTAFGPFSPFSSSYVTLEPSASER